MVIIKTKNKSFSGVIANIRFVLGEGKVEKLNDDDRVWFERYDAEIIDETEDETEKKSKTTRSKKEETKEPEKE